MPGSKPGTRSATAAQQGAIVSRGVFDQVFTLGRWAMSHPIKHVVPFGLAVAFLTATAVVQAQHQLDDQRIGTAAGTKATAKDGIGRIEWPRDDVPVKVDRM